MAEGVYKIVEVVGVSEKSWEDAGRNAVEYARDRFATSGRRSEKVGHDGQGREGGCVPARAYRSSSKVRGVTSACTPSRGESVIVFVRPA